MKKRSFFKGIAVLSLIFAMVLASCSNDPEEVVLPNIGNPVVTEKLVSGGVMLSWPAIIEASGYQVWRSNGGQPAPLFLNSNPNSSFLYEKDGVYNYYDVVSFTNELKPATKYTYSVIALPSYADGKDAGRWNKDITTGTFPDQGSRIEKPANVSFVINSEKESITVTITPPASGNIPIYYYVRLLNDKTGNQIDQDWTAQLECVFNNVSLTDGLEFAVNVTGCYVDSKYYKESEIFKTEKQKYETLFAADYNLPNSFSIIYSLNTTDSIITDFYVRFYPGNSSYKPGVNYTLQRAIIDTMGNPGAYSDANFYINDTSTTYKKADFTIDELGNPSYATLYDKLDFKEANYQYRMKAEKGVQIEYKSLAYSNSYYHPLTVSVKFSNFITSVNINVTKDSAAATTDKFTFTPSVNYRNMLKDGDKLVIYYVVGESNSSYQTGYTESNTITFTQSDLDKTAVTAKTLTLQKNTVANQKYLFAQAYLIFEDETKRSVNWNSAAYAGSANGNDVVNLYY